MNLEKQRMSNIGMIFTLAIMSFYFLPALQQSIKFYVILVLAIGFVICTIMQANQYYLKILISATIIAVLYRCFGDAKNTIEIISKLYYFFMSFFPGLLFHWYIQKSSKKQQLLLWGFLTVLFVIVFKNTYSELMVNENVTRAFATANEMNNENIGTYDFVYATGALIASFGAYFLMTEKWYIKVIIIAVMVIGFYFLLIAQYTIALIGVIIALVIMLTKHERRINVKFLLILGLLMFFMVINPVLLWVATKVPSEQMSIRLTEVANFFGNGDAGGYNMNGRLSLYGKAISAFLHSPIMGNKVLRFDSHSTILAVAARLGIGGITTYVYMLLKTKKQTEKYLGIKEYGWAYTPVFTYLIVMGITNPIHSALMTNAMVWFYVPLSIVLCRHYLIKTRIEVDGNASMEN